MDSKINNINNFLNIMNKEIKSLINKINHNPKLKPKIFGSLNQVKILIKVKVSLLLIKFIN